MIKLLKVLRLYVIRLPEELRLYVIRPPEVCWRSARGVVDWIVAAPSTYRGWLLEVCQRSAVIKPPEETRLYLVKPPKLVRLSKRSKNL